jgi:hypothetical protein
MFETLLENIKIFLIDYFGWFFSVMEALPSLMYRSLFGVSFIIMFLLAIIFYVISAFTINDVAKHENSSKMFGGKNQRSRGPTDRPTAKQTILGLL